MATFQVIFRNGRVQNLEADRWKRKNGQIQFERRGGENIVFEADQLIMIEEALDDSPAHQSARDDEGQPA